MGKKSKKITKDMTFAELMEFDSEAGAKLAERGLFCGGCPMAQFETIENGALAHGVDVDELLKELNGDAGAKETALPKDTNALRSKDTLTLKNMGDGDGK